MPIRKELFWGQVDQSGGPTACWLWLGGTDPKGYGHATVEGRRDRAHRFAFEFGSGQPIPKNLVVRHICDNPPCCNPAHLALGTHAENNEDAVRRGIVKLPDTTKPPNWHNTPNHLRKRKKTAITLPADKVKLWHALAASDGLTFPIWLERIIDAAVAARPTSAES